MITTLLTGISFYFVDHDYLYQLVASFLGFMVSGFTFIIFVMHQIYDKKYEENKSG